jgi:phospholipase D1/2
MAAYQEAFTPQSDSTPVLQPGRNCWRIERAHRFSLLIDADAYFRAVRAAIRTARHSVFILSWDIDSRTHLVPEGANDGYPEPLGEFLHAVIAARPELHIYILNWDFAMVYALEREWLPAYKLGWRGHRRLEFWMDGRHPVSASHHQKVVVVDDALAFVGGLDLTRCRWDTPEHACNAPLRCDAEGKPHGPFHDVQSMVDGDVARALGDLVRSRWKRATTRDPVAPRAALHDPWPQGIVPDLCDIDIAIARTEPALEDSPGVHEVRQLHLDAIASAKHHLFFENQYFTSGQVATALAQRLAEPDGPEVVVVSPQTQSGWLEEATMGVLRSRVHRRLKTSDRHGRYRLYAPFLPNLEQGCLNVHSKVFAVDDDLFCVGSANLSNRSMAFDTECNIAIEASGDAQQRQRIRHAIARLRSRLLAEHLDTTPEVVEQQVAQHGGLIAGIEALQTSERSLRDLEPIVSPDIDRLIPDSALIDPERPMKPDELAAYLVPKEAQRPVPRRLIGLGTLAVALALLAIAWRWTPLREYANLSALVGLARALQDMPFTPVAVVASYVIAGLMVAPVMLLIAVTGIVFGPVLGTLYALTGTLLSAAVTFWIGHWLGRETVQRLVGPRIKRLSLRLARRGIVAMLVIRMLPIAPFTVVNVVAGASDIRFRDYMLGTFIGMTPGTIITVTFVHHLAEAVRNPSLGTITVLGVVAATLIGVAIGLQRLLDRKAGSEVQ